MQKPESKMQIVKILLPCIVIAGCLNTNEIQKMQTSSSVEQKIYKSKSGFQYLTLKALEEENDLYHPASFLINGIWLHHFKKSLYVLSVSEGKFIIKVSSVSKLP
ncbi:MAG TPA: hypothetical protein VLA13_09665, partial [Massilibacterium sp.]|nr:hypothetical protein [Massilibacterium sp.]